MKSEHKVKEVGRRQFLRALGLGSAAATTTAPPVGAACADPENRDERRRASYQPNSLLIQKFYAVNRYPTGK